MTEWLNFFVDNWPQLYRGMLVTLQLTVVGLACGILLGLPAALLRVYGGGWLRGLATVYIELFRGTPVLVQLFVIYFGLPQFGFIFDRMTAAMIAMSLNSGAYQAEYFRGAIQAIGGGQMRAARAIGMSRLKAIRYIILPQAVRYVIPAWSNEPISLMKASAVAFLIAVPDLMGQGKTIAARTYDPISAYLAVAVVYIVLVFLLTGLLSMAEKYLKIPGLEPESSRQ